MCIIPANNRHFTGKKEREREALYFNAAPFLPPFSSLCACFFLLSRQRKKRHTNNKGNGSCACSTATALLTPSLVEIPGKKRRSREAEGVSITSICLCLGIILTFWKRSSDFRPPRRRAFFCSEILSLPIYIRACVIRSRMWEGRNEGERASSPGEIKEGKIRTETRIM